MLRGPNKDTIYELENEVVSIGRGRRNEIIIQDNEVSRDHCRLVRILDQYELHDLNSSNGTYVDGKRIDSAGYILDSKTMIELGDSITFEYSLDDDSYDNFDVQKLNQLPDLNELHLYLVIDIPEKQEQSIYPLNNTTTTIGRGQDNDILIQEAVMSRHHLRITLLDNQYFVEDLNSLNGSQINGKKLTSAVPLRVNDMINVGKAVQIYCTDKPSRQVKHSSLPVTQQLQGENIDIGELKTKQLEAREVIKALADKTTTEVSISALETTIRKPLQEGQLKGHIFVSYAMDDYTNVVESLFQYTSKHGLPFWYGNDIPPKSKYWEDAFDQALLECVLLIVVVSPAAFEDKYVQKGLTYFVNRKKPVVLLEYEPVKRLPLVASDLPKVPYEASDLIESIKNLRREIRNQLR